MSSGIQGALSGAPAPTLPELAVQIREEIAAAEQGHRTALLHAISAGELLQRAKDRVEHGGWLPWLSEEKIPRRTASRYLSLASNGPHVAHLNSVREAEAEVAKINRENKPPKTPKPRDPAASGELWENEDVLAWLAKRVKARPGATREQFIAESKTREDWPLSDKHLTQAGHDRGRAINEDRQRRGYAAPPRVSGKRLHKLYKQRQENPTNLTELQIDVMKAVGVLEGFEISEVGIDAYERDLVLDLRRDLEVLREWAEKSLAVVAVAAGDQNQKARLAAIRTTIERGATEGERLAAQRAYDRALGA